MRHTIKTTAAAGMLALGALSLSACSVVASIAPGLAPSPTPTSIAGHNPSDVTILKAEDGTPSLDQRRVPSIAAAGLTIMEQILLAHPEVQHGSFAQTQQNWDSLMAPALKPLLNDAAFQATEQKWVAEKQSIILTNVIGVPDQGKSPVGITWRDGAGKACTLADKPFDVSLDKPSVGAPPSGVGGYVFEDVASVVMHCKEGTTVSGKVDYHLTLTGNGHANEWVATDWDFHTPGGFTIK